MDTGQYHSLLKVGAIILAAVLFSACVSDTLSTQNTEPQTLAEENPPSYDPVQREQAVAEIREKAAQPGSGELTNAYTEANGPNEPLTPSEQAARINELEHNAAQNNGAVSDAELASKQKSIRELQNQARNHYKNAVNTIKN